MTNRIQEKQLRDELERLSNIEGSGTELITVYIPPDGSLRNRIQELNQEHAEAGNIQSKDTRKRVQSAISKIINVLESYEGVPENGLAVFSGYVESEGEYITEVIDSFPKQIPESTYHCDKQFYTEPLDKAVAADGDYILIILDKNDAVIGEVVGTSVKVVETFSSLVPGKTQAGGFSQARFRRLREEAKENFFKDIAESINNRYVEKRHDIDGIFIGAPEPTKTEFVNEEYLHHELQDKILAETSISTTTEAGLRQLLDECQGAIEDQEITRQREYCERFLSGLSNEDKHVTYGVDQTLTAIDYGAVDTLLISENLPPNTEEQLHEETDNENILQYLEQSIEEYGSDIVFISDDFEEGNQLREAFGGIAAILRYPIN